MAALFAVFLIAILVVVLHPDGRKERMARIGVIRTRALAVGKAVLDRGSQIIELIAAWLAPDNRSRPAP